MTLWTDDPRHYAVNDDGGGSWAPTTRLDLGVSEVHVPGAVGNVKRTRTPTSMFDDDDHDQYFAITAKERRALPKSRFGDPASKKYPLDSPARIRNAAARLEQQKGSMSPGKYKSIRGRIARAAKKNGIDSKYNEKKTSAATATPGPVGRGLRFSVTHPDGTRVDVRHMAAYAPKDDTLFLSFAIDKAEALADGDENGRVWIQIARTGFWKGHPQGPFQLTPQTFDALVKNFRTQGQGRVQWDFDHCSEMAPTSGSRPEVGCPAQGWIYDLKSDGSRLYALTEWLPLAKDYIREDKYQGQSPAIKWKNKDRVSGAEIGPLLTSVALTNSPFLTGLEPLKTAASATGVESENADGVVFLEPEKTLASAYAYAPSEYMPRVKAALKLADGANPIEVGEHFGRMRTKLDDADGDLYSLHDGSSLGDYCMSLRDLVQPPLGTTMDDLLDIVEDLISVAIDEHNAIYHPDGPPDASAASATGTEAAPPTEETTTMTTPADANDTKTLLAASQSEVQALSNTVKVKDGEIESLKEQNKTLLTWKAEREEKDAQAAVTAAIETYKDKNKQCVEGNRATLLSMYKHDSAGFDVLFPPVAPAQRHLLRTFTNDGRAPTNGAPAPRSAADAPANPDELPEMTLMSLAENIARSEGITIEQASLRAEQIVNRAKAAKKK